ncbi:MAG: Ig-like domain-containing protein [Rubrivivax sp.]
MSPSPSPPASPAPAALTVLQGDNQYGAVGVAAPVSPRVQVTDAQGRLLAGVPVQFSVTAGGGSIEHASVDTDAAGEASPGAWTLGPATGYNRLTASVSGVPAVTLTAIATRKSADVTVSGLQPGSGEIVQESFPVTVRVSSTYSIASVTASTRGHSVALAYANHPPWGMTWGATLSLAGEALGDTLLVVQATDVQGNVTELGVPIALDRLPKLAVSQPADGSVPRPTIRATFSCSDDDPAGCSQVTAAVGGTVLASGRNAIDAVLDLSAWEGQQVGMVLSGVDSGGQAVSVTRTLFVESSAKLATLADLPGSVWDASPSRVLYLDGSAAVPALRQLDTASGASTLVESTPDLTSIAGNAATHGCLMPRGAVYWRGEAGSGTNPATPAVYEWRDGTVRRLVGLVNTGSLRCSGTWVGYVGDGYRFQRRELESGLLEDQPAIAYLGPATRYALAPNGEVFWSARTGPELIVYYDILRWHGPVVDIISSRHNTINDGPVTDGTHVVFYRNSQIRYGYDIMMFDGSVETLLSTVPALADGSAAVSYAAAGGYVAFMSPDGADVGQVWRRSPAGSLEQVTLFGTSSAVEAMLPDGTILLRNGGRRYVARPGAALVAVGSTLGRATAVDGRFLVLFDHTVLRVDP